MSESIRILDTGTRPADARVDGVVIRHQPALVRQPLDFSAADLTELTETDCHVVFYSRFAVDCVAHRLSGFDDHRLWAVGPKTAALIAEKLDAHAEFPDEHHFSALRRRIADCGDPRPIVAFGLRGQLRDLSEIADDWNTTFRSIDVYESKPAPADEMQIAFDEFQPDWLTVTSSRGAEAIAEALGNRRLAALHADGELSFAAIGPSTAKTLDELGLSADVVPEHPDRNRLVKTIGALESD